MKLLNKVVLYCRKPDARGIHHAYPVDIDSPSHETAQKWAKGRSSEGEVIKFTYHNMFDRVKLIGLDKRSEGGRAYQVLIAHDDKIFKVDLREDSLLDIILNSTIHLGELSGEYAFIQSSSQVKLIRIGSKEYEEAKLGLAKSELKKIPNSELVIGHLYENRSGQCSVYLGPVYEQTSSRRQVKKLAFLKYSGYYEGQVEEYLRTLYKDPKVFPMSVLETKTAHSFIVDKGLVTEHSRVQLIEGIRELARAEFDRIHAMYVKSDNESKGTYDRWKTGHIRRKLHDDMIPSVRQLCVKVDKNEVLDYRVNIYSELEAQ